MKYQCKYEYIKGAKKGTVCGKSCRSEYCSQHKPKISKCDPPEPPKTPEPPKIPEPQKRTPEISHIRIQKQLKIVPPTKSLIEIFGTLEVPPTPISTPQISPKVKLELQPKIELIEDDLGSCLKWESTNNGPIKIDVELLRSKIDIQERNRKIKCDYYNKKN